MTRATIVSRISIALAILFAAASFASQEVEATAGTTARPRAVRIPSPCLASALTTHSRVTDLAVDENYVYFGDMDGNIGRVSRRGGASTTVTSVPGRWVLFIAVDQSSVYFQSRDTSTERESVYAAPKNGGEPTLLIPDIGYVFELIPDGEWLYVLVSGTAAGFMMNTDGRILRVRKDGSAIEELVSSLHVPMAMLLDGDNIYFSERGVNVSDPIGGVRRVPKQGGAVTSLVNMPGAIMMAQDASNLYVLRITGSDTGDIDIVSKADGAVTRFLTGIRFEATEPLHVFEGSLYFMNRISDTRARAEAVRLATGERRTLAEFDWGFPQFAIDSCGVYYSTPTGINRAAH